jgi:hypothetical protein
MKITEYFHETGETIERDATAEEVASFEVTPTLEETQLQKLAAKQAILDKLGLTAEEAAALIS